jgi:hypothetical protein
MLGTQSQLAAKAIDAAHISKCTSMPATGSNRHAPPRDLAILVHYPRRLVDGVANQLSLGLRLDQLPLDALVLEEPLAEDDPLGILRGIVMMVAQPSLINATRASVF